MIGVATYIVVAIVSLFNTIVPANEQPVVNNNQAQHTEASVKVEQPKKKIEPPKPIEYIVKPGDSLSVIAKVHEVPVDKVWAKNTQLEDQNKIKPGDVIVIPGKDENIAPRAFIEPEPVNIPVATTNAPSTPQNVPSGQTIAGCGDNEYANFIYMRESGCNTAARNAGGCLGIGQACPGSKLLAVCPNLDYACQNQFFTSYAIGRYGSWQGAYNFWQANHWW